MCGNLQRSQDDRERPQDVITPMTVLTGFLGAGKTTLLTGSCPATNGLRVGVLANDFGSIKVDADLIVDIQDEVVSLANGCVCCSIRDDLTEAILQLLDRPERPEYLLLEASDVADPTGSPSRPLRTRIFGTGCALRALSASSAKSRSSAIPN